jgi:outer membrane protein OmpA-like peptidoglycan-associated protein
MDCRAFELRAAAVVAVLALAGCAMWTSETATPAPPPTAAPEPAAGGSTVDQAPATGGGAQEAQAIKKESAQPAPAAPAPSAQVDAEPKEPEPQSAGGANALSAYPDEGAHPLQPVGFHDAMVRAADALFKQARSSIGNERRSLVIDPLVDGATGQQTASTVEMGKILSDLMRQQYPTLTPRPLTRAALAEQPVLFIGTLTPFSTTRSSQKPADAFRIWLTLIDLRTGRIVAKVIDKATAGTIDAVPLSYYRDSPTWPRDKTVAAYINSCTFKTKIGDPADPAYLARLPAAATINEAMDAFAADHFEEANRLFHEAADLAEQDDLRILNGLYLTSWKLGRQEQARAAFERIVTAGLRSQRLPLKFLFVPARAELVQMGDLGSQYTMWLQEVAQQATQQQVCLRVVGHTSRTGTTAMNDSLSLTRASWIRNQLSTDAPDLAVRLAAEGKGFRENLIGLGTDDLRDALDRRVELVVSSCPS